mmetsp:Transcript_142630/g.397443  ORF Transcript_142630/g.397443 Transcript_142630/m.397443 type:complete len:304 (-) Transcript_142630:312-1223(-)
MPPIARHKDDIARTLDPLVDLELWMRTFDPRQDEVEVHDGFVVLTTANHVPPLHDLARLLRLKQHPTFAPMRDSVPSRCTQGVGVHRRSRALGSNAKPAVGRPGIVVHKGEPVVREKIRQIKVVHQRSYVAVVIHICLEKVERAVVLLLAQVVRVVLELHPQLLALVVLCHLERHVLEPLLERLNGPPMHGWPAGTSVLNDDWDVLARYVLIKPLGCDVLPLEPPDGHRLGIVLDGPREDLVFVGITKLVPLHRFDIRALGLLATQHLRCSAPVRKLHGRLPRRRGRFAAGCTASTLGTAWRP